MVKQVVKIVVKQVVKMLCDQAFKVCKVKKVKNSFFEPPRS